MRLRGDDLTGDKTEHWETADPTKQQISKAIEKLDGEWHTEVTLSEDEPFRYLSVSGGPELYLVTGETEDEKILALLDKDAGTDKVNLVCGGQEGGFERRQLVDRAAALAAVDEFRAGFPDGFDDRWDVQQ